jgi:hypothetical protein
MDEYYKLIWNNLKKWVEERRDSYKRVTMCSISESVHGESNYSDMLNMMEILEVQIKGDSDDEE